MSPALRPLLCAMLLALAAESAAVDYLGEVKPLLAAHCVTCHGADQQKGGLRLDTAAALRAGGDTGPGFIAGDASRSLLIQAVEDTHDDISRMPYRKPPLAAEQIALLRRWVAAGAPAPADEEPSRVVHWAFVKPVRPPEPAVRDAAWVRNPIDRFILARLERDRIKPSPPADRITGLRRVHLDLTGLPPTPAEVDAYLADPRPDAYERVVEALLASPHYGERMARPWLDAARYADSNGYSIDAPRSIWPWRDWVIRALNDDLPFDQFVIEQMAGDLLPDASLAQRVATGFHRNTQINQEGGIDPEQFRIESVIDRVNTTSTVLLGLTVACAQCHDHKFDPVSQREYFQFFAFFNAQDEPTLEVGTPEEFARRETVRATARPLREELEARARALEPGLAAWEAALTPAAREKLPTEAQHALGLRAEDRSPAQRRAALHAYYAQDAEYRDLQQRLRDATKDEPKFPETMVLAERAEPRTNVVFIAGDFTRPGAPVTPGTPAVLHPFQPRRTDAPPDRLDLAHWLVDPANPLTARVTVNRIWQHYFGRGLVETENDFGTQGTPPSHPELLDWLAVEFMTPEFQVSSSGSKDAADQKAETSDLRSWSLKHLHRLIVTSATYRQSSHARPDLAEKDPTNRLLARQNRLRLDAEIVRDVALAASGALNPAVGGPPVFPPQPDGVMALGQVRREWKPSEGPERFRRGLYTFFWRATPHPALTVFDAPDAFSACTRRLRSNTPLQALTLLNDAAFVELAEALASRVEREAPPERRLEHAFRLCLARPPQPAERERLLALLDEEQRDQGEPAAWRTVARVLLNLDETITRE